MAGRRLHPIQGMLVGVVALGMFHGIASADVVFQTGNFQLTNVNFDSTDPTAMTITGNVGNTGHFVFFNGFGASPTYTPVLLHASHGAASISQGNINDHIFQLTLTAETGFAFSAMDWKLDAHPPSDGQVTFTAYDSQGNVIADGGVNTFFFDHNGQNPFHAHTTGGSMISMLVITSTVPILDIKQVSVDVVPIPAPTAAAAAGLACGLLASRHRR